MRLQQNGAPLGLIGGRRPLQALFIETHRGGGIPPLYTLKDFDHNGYPSLYRLYMEIEDPTEFLFARKYLRGWEHWQMLCECTWFQPIVTRWRLELELSIKAKALSRLKQMADEEGKERLQANKALLDYEKYLEKKLSRRVGRPKKIREVDTTVLDKMMKEFTINKH